MLGFFGRPNNAPSEPAFLQQPDTVAGAVEFPPAQAVGGATWLSMMIVVVPFTHSDYTDPKIVPAVIGCIETPISELTHVADGIDRPRNIINHQHRHVETPKEPSYSEREIEGHGDSKMRQHI